MSEFLKRHIGPSESDQRKMLADLGLSTIDELVREIVPDSILLRGDSNLPEGCSEQEALTESSSFSEQASDANFSMRGIDKLPVYTKLIKNWYITNVDYKVL